MVSSNLPGFGTLDFMVLDDHSVYVKSRTREIMFLTLYFDDILLVGDNLEMIKAANKWLSSIFKIEDMRQAKYALSVEIVKNHLKMLLDMCQEAYIKSSWNAFGCIILNRRTRQLRRV